MNARSSFRKFGDRDGKGRRMDESFFERPILNSPYAYPAPALGAGRRRPADQPDHRDAPALRADHAGAEAAEAAARAGQAELGLGAGDGLSTAEQEYNPTPIINEIRGYVDDLAQPAEPRPMAGHAGDRAAAPALAASSIRGPPPVLLPDRGGRDGDLAGRGRAEAAARGREDSGRISAAPTRRRTPSCCASR